MQNATMRKFSVMVDEIAPREHRPGCLRQIQRHMLADGCRSRLVSRLRLPDFFGQRKVKVGEINVADESGNGRHDDV